MKGIEKRTFIKLGISTVLLLLLLILGSSGSTWVQGAEAAIALPSWCPTIPTVPTIPVPTVPTFPDVPASFWAFEYIETLANYGYVAGFPDGNYYPTNAVTRAQMAVFIERADKGTGFTPTVPTVPPFPDVALSFWAADWIAAAAADGFVVGFPDGNYYPLNSVTRAQAAVFITGLHQGTSFVPTVPSVPPFPDVIVSFWASSWIAQALADELVAGFPDGNYYPLTALTRAQMAVLVSLALCMPGFP
jgi:hypothetical protein